MPRLPHCLLAALVATTALLSGCTDDGASVRELGGSSGSASGSGGSSSASGSSSLAEEDLSSTTDDQLVLDGVARYEEYVGRQVEELRADTSVFTDAVRAGDLRAARSAYAPSRVSWERIEPIAGLVAAIDTAVDARVDDFAGATDPDFTGWHRLEYLLFERGTTRGAAPFADRLDAGLARLDRALDDARIPPAAVPVGAAELVEEVSLGKITGEENRYAKTDLWDFDANLDGSEAAIEALTPARRTADPELLRKVQDDFAALEATLRPFRRGGGWELYCLADDEFPSPRCEQVTVDPQTVATLQSQLGALSEDVSLVAGALGLG